MKNKPFPSVAGIIQLGIAKEYEKYEFCRAVDCAAIRNYSTCRTDDGMCFYTAKTFHKWLEDNGFKIVKETND